MGEAFVAKGDLASAREQLREIENVRTRCLEYAKLFRGDLRLSNPSTRAAGAERVTYPAVVPLKAECEN